MPRVYIPATADEITDKKELAVISSNGELKIVNADELDKVIENVESNELYIYTLNTVLKATDIEIEDNDECEYSTNDYSTEELRGQLIDTLSGILAELKNK